MGSALRLVSAKDPSAVAELRELNERMADFYNQPVMQQYFALAHEINEQWTPQGHHWLVRMRAASGLRVLDMGCGSGHAYLNLKDTGVSYTGLDWSRAQVEANQNTYGAGPRFVAASLYDTGLPSGEYDLAFSFYVLEHLVWPHRFLAEMVRVTRTGGTLVIVCPHFRPAGRIPSLPYGQRVAPLRDKLRQGHLFDGLRHLYLRNLYYPRIIQRDYPRARFPFLINVRPSCLRGTYYQDNDAVYLVDRDEIVAELVQLGATDCTQEALREWNGSEDGQPDVCCVVARKQ